MSSVALIITTKNRKEELRTALQSAAMQTATCDIHVFDDGSTDGTSEMVREEFPQARLHTADVSRGLIVRRNELASLATADILVSIDDDAAFSTPHVIEQTLREFSHPRIGAVAIPFINVNQDSLVRQRATRSDRVEIVSAYIGTAHAVRRDVFLALGGYRDYLVHQGEEGDYCLRMLAAGYVVRAGLADPIYHFESPRRSFERMDFYGRRNDLLFMWQNVPAASVPAYFVANTASAIRLAFRTRRCRHFASGFFAGCWWCATNIRRREPVSAEVYRLHRKLKKQGPLPLETILDRLPAPREVESSATRPHDLLTTGTVRS